MDFTKNPLGDRFSFALLSEECRSYLSTSSALLKTPVERLLKLNKKAYDIYSDNSIDLKHAPIEICVAAQHNNGGLAVDSDCRTTVGGLFAVGEAAATFGIYRPGGTALNATQVDAVRATASIIKQDGKTENKNIDETKVSALLDGFGRLVSGDDSYKEFRARLQKRMSDDGAFVRNRGRLKKALDDCLSDIENFEKNSVVASPDGLPDALRNRDLITTQAVYLFAMLDYIEKGGSGRGSFVVEEDGGALRPFVNGDMADFIQYVTLSGKKCAAEWRPVRPVPNPEMWFENVFRKGS